VVRHAVIVSEPAEKAKTIAVDLQVPSLNKRCRHYIWKDDRSRQLQVGDALLIRTDGSQFVRASEWQHGGRAYASLSRVDLLRIKALKWRHQLLHRYRSLTGHNDHTYAVLAAMTLGDKTALSADMKDDYAVSGASHILAMSGMHLGVIYMLLSFLLMGRRRFWLSQVVIILCVWAFAFLTGLSTSIVRSATMISIYALFFAGGRQRASVNLLCMTAMVMLLGNADYLYDIGFQLSFMAVLAILVMQPLADRLVSQKYLQRHQTGRWLWSTVWVSTAAQLGVAPLVAYHFGRFSTYFLLTNLIVLSLAILILYGALLFLLTSWTVVGQALVFVVDLLNRGVTIIAALPMASIEHLHLSVVQVCMVYTVIICIYLMAMRIIPQRYY